MRYLLIYVLNVEYTFLKRVLFYWTFFYLSSKCKFFLISSQKVILSIYFLDLGDLYAILYIQTIVPKNYLGFWFLNPKKIQSLIHVSQIFKCFEFFLKKIFLKKKYLKS